MKIILVGGGKVGTALARQLSEEDHNVTIVDTNKARVEHLTESYDVLGIVGNGSSITTLAEAGIDPVEGDFECAVTDGTLVLRSGTDTNVYEMMKSLDDDFRDLLKSAGVSLSGLFLLLKEELDHDE